MIEARGAKTKICFKQFYFDEFLITIIAKKYFEFFCNLHFFHLNTTQNFSKTSHSYKINQCKYLSVCEATAVKMKFVYCLMKHMIIKMITWKTYKQKCLKNIPKRESRDDDDDDDVGWWDDNEEE